MRLRIWVVIIAAVVLTACAGIGGESAPATEPVVEPSYVPEPGLSDKARFREALLLLERGEAEAARAELALYLNAQPTSKVARDLIRQIDLPAHDYFPADFREVMLPSGVSLSSLSKRYLGSVFKFHALAKYNGIRRPGDLTAGQDIKVPLTAAAMAAFAADDAIVEPQQEQQRAAEPTENPVAEAQENASALEEQAAEEVKAAAAVEAMDAPAEPALSKAEVEKLHRTALGAYRAQNLDKAIALWDRVLDADAEHESARLYRSQAIELQRKLRKLN